ncbi:MAG: AAA family ATPase [Gammaproteobacteria bacterium]|nr:AAA family ATPase [Gammaproteobacteria bacterium]NNJ50745.1 AAA family ATPase [Gammaproteobacteria bacterium]
MYEAFYGFKEKPFSMLPDPGFLYLSKKHQAALTLLEYGLLNQVGFCVISGEPGAGKTTILRALLERVGEDTTIGLITNTHQSFGGLLDWVLSAFDLHRPNLTHVEMHQVFMEFLIEEYGKGRTVLLIVDEAQNMKADALEELRMLSNINSEKDQLMQVVLAGQPALKETLKLPDLMQFAQRVAVDYHLDSLNLEETCGYIQHRLKTAGAQRDIFTPAACQRIFNYSGGTPRLINLLCETVLVYGFADQQEMIDVDLVDEMVLERMKDSVVPIVNRDVALQDNSEASKELEKNFPWIASSEEDAGSTAHSDSAAQAAEPDATRQILEQHVKADTVEANDLDEGLQSAKTEDNSKQAVAAVAQDQPDKGKTDEEIKPQVARSPLASVEKAIASDEAEIAVEDTDKAGTTRKQLIKYGVIAVIIGAAMIVFAMTLQGYEPPVASDTTNDAAAEAALKLQKEQDEKKLRELQIEAETLKRERDAAIAKAEAERLANEQAEKLAEKQAAEAAAIAAKAAAEKTRAEELKRLEAAKKREREAKKAEAKAREAAQRAKLEAARLEEQKRLMQMRLEEERKMKQLQEARRLELERQEAERLRRLAVEEQAKLEAVEAAAAKEAEEASKKSADCSGPTARFKSNCR